MTSKQVTSPPWNSRRGAQAKKWFGHCAGRSPCAHSIGKFFLCYIVLFLLETSAPGLSGHYWYRVWIIIARHKPSPPLQNCTKAGGQKVCGAGSLYLHQPEYVFAILYTGLGIGACHQATNPLKILISRWMTPMKNIMFFSNLAISWIWWSQIHWLRFGTYIYIYMDVSKNRGTPKWMVYNGKPY